MIREIYLLILLCCFLTSCISNKQTVYLQKNSDTIEEAMMVVKQLPPYKVQINDMLSIRVKALDQELSNMFNPIPEGENLTSSPEGKLYYDGFLVDDHGQVEIPLLGKIKVLNLTTKEISLMIKEKLLSEYFTDKANLFVTVKLGGVKYTSLGEIKNNGTNVVFQERVNILEAIANAGDITEVGNRKKVMIIRPYPGGFKSHRIDLTDIEVMSSPYFYIQPNDIIYVEPLKQKSWGTGKTGVESFTTILTVFSAITTTILLLRTL